MKANEVMIGDCVKIKTYGVSDKYERTEAYIWVKVAEIGSGLITVEYNNDIKEPYRICENTEIVPIPLTHEILEKNGFNVVQYSDGDYYADIMFEDQGRRVEVEYRYGDIDVRVSCRNNASLSRVETQVRYIHELQNIFRIMQINKEIVL